MLTTNVLLGPNVSNLIGHSNMHNAPQPPSLAIKWRVVHYVMLGIEQYIELVWLESTIRVNSSSLKHGNLMVTLVTADTVMEKAVSQFKASDWNPNQKTTKYAVFLIVICGFYCSYISPRD